mmetsp:Transcript_9261/g.19920  ORF Transcript_9261/g.19920 Transcript_9261/m.19920 type:complete len:253 (-) Transcript_9261:933-1691(-)
MVKRTSRAPTAVARLMATRRTVNARSSAASVATRSRLRECRSVGRCVAATDTCCGTTNTGATLARSTASVTLPICLEEPFAGEMPMTTASKSAAAATSADSAVWDGSAVSVVAATPRCSNRGRSWDKVDSAVVTFFFLGLHHSVTRTLSWSCALAMEQARRAARVDVAPASTATSNAANKGGDLVGRGVGVGSAGRNDPGGENTPAASSEVSSTSSASAARASTAACSTRCNVVFQSSGRSYTSLSLVAPGK